MTYHEKKERETIMEMRYQYQEHSERDFLPIPFSAYRLTTFSNQQHIPLHWHRELELTYIETPGWIEIEGECFPHQAGDIICVNKGLLHHSYTEEKKEAYLLVFDLDLLSSPFTQNNDSLFLNQLIEGKLLFPEIVSPDQRGYGEIKDLLLRGVSLWEKHPSGWEVSMQSILLELVYCFYVNGLLRSHVERLDTPKTEYVKKTIRYMKQNFSQEITIEELAGVVSLSKSYYIRVFKKLTGQTPLAYLNHIRLEESRLFLNQGKTVTETAILCGIPNVSYYIRSFKEHFGMTPKSYQQQDRL
jgi:AraC family transcriptional activator of mtrCDE